MSRRSYVLTLLACLAGAAVSLYAITRTWSIHLTPRPGMSDLREARTGTDVEPWVTGLALVALAGTGALLATAGRARRALGVVLALAGVGVLIGAITGRAGLDPGAAGTGGTVWPVACALGGVIIVAGGVTAALRGHRWPRMSARYDRKPVVAARAGSMSGATASGETASGETASAETVSGETARPRRERSTTPVDHRAAWDALDRGDDPTAG